MTKTFKAGDKVRCVDSSGVERRATEGETYTVRWISPNGRHVRVEGVPTSFMASRFELVTDLARGFKVGDLVEVIDEGGDNHRMHKRGMRHRVTRVLSPEDGDAALVKVDAGYEVFAKRFKLYVPEPKRQPIKSIKVDQKDILTVLSAYVKDTLGIDADVKKLAEAYAGAIELTLTEAAAS